MRRNNRSLLRIIRSGGMPHVGEYVEVYQHKQLLAGGNVITADQSMISIAGTSGIVDLDTLELRRGLFDGSITIKRPGEDKDKDQDE